MAELVARSTSKIALVENSAAKPRHYVAIGVPSNHHHHSSDVSDIDADITHLHKGCYRPYFATCCVSACIGLFTLVIIFSTICFCYIAFLKAGKPQVNVRRLSINNLQSMNNAIISLEVRVSNRNEKLNLLYGPLNVDVFTKDVKLGRIRVEGFSHKPQNDTYLDMTITLDNAQVNTQILDQLKSGMNANEIVFDVYLSGSFGMGVGRLHLTVVPFLSCCQIKHMDVENGRNNECDFKIFAFRSCKAEVDDSHGLKLHDMVGKAFK